MTQEIRIENLKNHPKNIRKTYGNLKELAASIRENGVLQNLIVVPDPKKEGAYLVVAGNCRLRAAKKAGLETLPCNIVEMSEKEQVLTILTENMQRNGLSVAEEAAGIQMCLEDFGMKVPEVAKATGLSVSTVRSRRNIAKLDLATVKEKTANPEFQLSITDLNSLSKVKDVDKRNEILSDATDSKNLKWKIEQAMKDEVKEKNLAALAALLEDAGIAFTADVSSSDLYGNKWDTVKSFYLSDEAPATLFEENDAAKPDDLTDLMYVVHYNYLKIIRKHKAEKRQLTESEIEERRVKKSRREIKSLYQQMHAEMASFVQALINEHLFQPNDPPLLLEPLWNVVLKKASYISASSIVSIMTGKESYQLCDSEKSIAYERTYGLPLYQQMMAVAVKDCNDLELMDYKGHYSDHAATIFLTLYSCLNCVGFSFSNDEYEQVMDGTHELYEPWEDDNKEDTAMDTGSAIGDTEDDNTMAGDAMNGYDEDYLAALIEEYENDVHAGDAEAIADNGWIPVELDDEAFVDMDAEAATSDMDDDSTLPNLQDGFVKADDLSDIPFENEETDYITEEFPTVYSTEGGFTFAYKSSDNFNEIDEAA